MNARRPALGKGLSALFPATVTSQSTLECPIDLIDAGAGQPRTRFNDEALADLAASIREAGIIQPLVVSMAEGGRYSLIAGERRLRAARLAGLVSVPVVVRQAEPENAFIMALVENIQREDLNPVEQARAFARLTREFGLKQEDIAKRVGRQRSTVANSLRLLKLEQVVLDAVEDGRLAEGTARTLIGLDAARQFGMLEVILEKGLTTREAEDMIRRTEAAPRKQARREPPAMAAYFSGARLELEEILDLPVTISYRGNRGKLSILFSNLSQFKSLRAHLSGAPSYDGDKKQPPAKKAG